MGYTNGQRLRELPELWKMAHRLVAVRAKNKIASVGSSRMITVALRLPILKQKKWCATISLGLNYLNYCSMVSSKNYLVTLSLLVFTSYRE
jgi:type VI protein secretion system component VasA